MTSITCLHHLLLHSRSRERSISAFVIASGGSRGVSEVSTETPFCCDCIIAYISQHAQLTYCIDASLRLSRASVRDCIHHSLI